MKRIKYLISAMAIVFTIVLYYNMFTVNAGAAAKFKCKFTNDNEIENDLNQNCNKSRNFSVTTARNIGILYCCISK